MSKFVCKVCGYIHEGDSAPERCPQCKVPADKFEKVEEKKMSWVFPSPAFSSKVKNTD